MARRGDAMGFGEADAEATGRPRALDARLRAYAAALDAHGFPCGPAALQAMAFWDECLSPSLGEPVGTVGFEEVDGVPRSRAVAREVASWTETGLARDPRRDPDSSRAMRAPECDLLEGAAALACPWGDLLRGFVSGFRAGAERGGPAVGDGGADDVLAMLRADPSVGRGWDGGGPGAVSDDMGRHDPALAGRRGNVAACVMEAWSAAARAAGMSPGTGAAASVYAMFLAARAAQADVGFGDAAYLDAASTTTVRERAGEADGRPVTVASFARGGEVVATAAMERRWRVEETFGEGGCRAELPDGTLLSVEGRSGTDVLLALRFAAATGCVRAAPPPPAQAATFAAHGCLRADGGYDLCARAWPVASPEDDG